MILKVIWSKFAEEQLDKIYTYYKKKVSEKTAKKLITAIIKEPQKLVETPFLGQQEELLKLRKIEYRYLVVKNYKLIYSVDLENGFIKINDVFDTRQNPPKIKRTK